MKTNLAKIRESLRAVNKKTHPTDLHSWLLWVEDQIALVVRLENELRELDLMKWLDQNHPCEKMWATYEANFLETLERFKKQVLGDSE